MLRSSIAMPSRMSKKMTRMVERYIRARKKTLPFKPSFSLLGALAMSSLLSLFLFLSFARDTQAAPGDLDPSFGTNGKVITNFSGCSNCPESPSGANAMAIQSDGKIVAAGFSSTFEPGIALARYNLDGGLDTTFGSSGMVNTKFSAGLIDIANAVAIDTEGKIVVTGVSTVNGSEDFTLIRYNTDGSLDTSFGTGGNVTTDFGTGNTDSANAIASQSDGKIVAAGSSFANGLGDFALARYNTDGSLDTSFGTGGKVLTNFIDGGSNDEANAVSIQTDGKIIVAGFSNANVGGFLVAGDFALARYNTDGSLDTSFGKVVTVFSGNGSNDVANAVVIQADGKIVAAGSSPVNDSDEFALARYNTDGSLDTSFGTGGKVLTDFGGSATSDVIKAVATQTDGKIVVAGSSGSFGSLPSGGTFALARYLGIGNTPSPNNNSGGCSIVGSGDTETRVANLLIPLIPALAISLRMLIRRKKDS